MSTYTVPQDVEADDKLLGPFSFRQFIYLIIVAFACVGGWLLSQIFIALIIVPLPVVVFFGALALPIKKDQPMETYLAAVISFYLKPKSRLWKADGVERSITISAPKVVEVDRTNGLSENEAIQRLSYLSNLTDSGGWAIKGSSSPVNDEIFREAMDTTDILDNNSQAAAMISERLTANDQRVKQQAAAMMQAPVAVQTEEPNFTLPPARPAAPSAPPTVQHFTSPTATAAPASAPLPTSVKFNPYPDYNQAVIQPLSKQVSAPPVAPTQPVAPAPAPVPPPEPSVKPVSPDIINLANNSDLSIETLAREAHRIEKKKDDGEVFISLH